MRSWNRKEVLSIAAIIVIAAGTLAIVRLYPSDKNETETEAEQKTEQSIIMVDPSADDLRSALVRAVEAASDESGRVRRLLIADLALGNGREVKIGDTVSVHYIGVLKDGPEFDNSYKRGAPFSFKVGAGEVIPGWEQGIIGMKERGKRALVIPPESGYGAVAVGPLPANATLLFSIELLSIQ